MRRAVYHAINIDLIVQKVLRGQAADRRATCRRWSTARWPSWTSACRTTRRRRVRCSPRPATRRLLGHARLRQRRLARGGLPGDRRDAEQVGIRTTLPLVARPTSSSRKLTQATAQLRRVRLDADGTDAWAPERAVPHLRQGLAAGTFNAGRYSNPKLDALIDAMRVEPDLARRRRWSARRCAWCTRSCRRCRCTGATSTGSMRPSVEAVQWPNDVLELRWVRMD